MAQGPTGDGPTGSTDLDRAPLARRRSRRGLFLPSILLLVLVLAWSAAWFFIRHRAESEMDGWIAAEARAGRTWTCADRSIAGFPFRLELRCSGVSFARSDGRFSLGPVTALVQVYDPRHGILEVKGPFHVEQGDLDADVTWDSLEASFHGTSNGFSRVSVVAEGPRGSVQGAEPGPIDFSVKHLEAHARPTPVRFDTDGAVDIDLRTEQVNLPLVDAVLGNAAPADMVLDATLNRATALRSDPVAGELERWRKAGGSLDIALLSLAKGDRRLQGKGSLALDEAHRPMGRLELRAAGLEALVAQVMGQRLGPEKGALIGSLVGKLLGGGRRRDEDGQGEAAAQAGDAALKPLPPLKFIDGRVMLGPFAIPNAAVPALY
ncbi:DUF2125 domain-containing protein [Methylobacterium sp. sgz302541]|uniref:DUF2125 domain-containing protein n=1 Tax=unclassified Methylobacterium TaxID=2615210 RepID=UPI003D34983B